MKIKTIIAFLFGFLFVGCNQEDLAESSGQTVPVNIVLGGDYSVSIVETPLTRAFSSTDLVYIALYSKGATDTNYRMESEFFNTGDTPIPTLNLNPKKKYQFKVDVVKNGTNLVYGTSTYRYMWSNGSSNNNKNLTTTFTAGSLPSYFGKGSFEIKSGKSPKYPETERFYAELAGYTPSETGAKDVVIDLKRGSFGIKSSVTGITDGTVDVTVKNASQTFLSQTGIADDWTSEPKTFTFFELYTAWYNADNYTEDVTVSVVWHRGVGVTQDLGSRDVTVKRNKINHIRINLGSNDGGSRVGISTESAPFAENEIVIDAHY